MFAIEATEFVQGHNDLVTAVAAVDKAQSRLALAQMAEKRQRGWAGLAFTSTNAGERAVERNVVPGSPRRRAGHTYDD